MPNHYSDGYGAIIGILVLLLFGGLLVAGLRTGRLDVSGVAGAMIVDRKKRPKMFLIGVFWYLVFILIGLWMIARWWVHR